MIITDSRFKNFRNLENGAYSWNPGLNLFLGPNGAGKTNTLEALHLTSGWGFFENAAPLEGVTRGKDFCRLAAAYDGEDRGVVELNLTHRVQLQLDGKRTTWTALRSRMPLLPFLPAHMALLENGPAPRRRFLDVIGALLFPLHPQTLLELRRVLRIKKKALVQGRSTRVADLALGPLVSRVWRTREAVLSRLNPWLERQTLAPYPLRLRFKRGGGGRVIDPLDDFTVSLPLWAQREQGAKTPLLTPTRDDMEILAGDVPAQSCLSRGQKRRAALSLVLAAGALLEEGLGRRPLILIDELASELDQEGRGLLVAELEKTGFQVFAAAAEWNGPTWPGTLWSVRCGRLTEERSFS